MPELNLFHLRTNKLGYGRFGINLAGSLRDLGVDVYTKMPMPPEAQLPHEDPGDVPSKRCHVVCWASVPGHARGWWSDQHPVLFTMWESGSLPEPFRETIHNFAQVIVPSHQNAELFSRYHPDVTMVPLGVDPKVWYPTVRPEVGREFRFLIGGTGPRKGTDLAYKAFRTAFATWPEDGPVPTLIMKNPKAEPFYGPNVEMITGHISDQAEVDLYATAHCYLQPSRGEGFGLQPLQALAQGCPTILTAAHGHDAFAHLGIGIPATRSEAAYFLYGDAGEWWEPDFDILVDQMRWVYSHYDQAVDRAALSATAVADMFTWEHTARRFIDAVVPDRLELPADPAAAWFAPNRKVYRTRVLRKWKCDIAGTTYLFEPGVDYLEVAEVKRILMETGVLDPVCMDGDDTGLAATQLAARDDYSASHSYCPTCSQRLNSQPTRADALEDACL